MSLHTGDIDRAWAKLGMLIEDRGDRHAKFYYGGKLIIVTKRSLGRGTLEGNIPHLIRQQMKLTQTEFRGVIECPIDRDGYVKILKQKNWIEATLP